MRLLLNIILIILSVAACYLEDIYLYLRPPQPDTTLYMTIRSRQAYRFNQPEALAARQQEALSLYVPVYRYIPPEAEAFREKFNNFEGAVAAFQKNDKSRVEGLRAQLQKDFGVSLATGDIANIAQYRDFKILLEGILTIEESILQNKIVGHALRPAGNKAIEIRNPDSAGALIHPVDDVITIEKARQLMEEKVRQLYWQVEKSVLDPLLRICLTTLQPNLAYDQNENDRRLEKITRKFPSGIVSYQPGEVLAAFGTVLNNRDIVLLEAYRQERISGIYRDILRMVFTIVLVVAFYNLFLAKVPTRGSRRYRPTCRLLSTMLITAVLIPKAYLVFVSLPIYGLPFSLLPMLILFLNQPRLRAAATTLAGALLVNLIIGPALDILLFFAFAGLAAVLASSGLVRRLQVIGPAALVGLINTLCVIVFTLDWDAVASQIGQLQTTDISALTTIVDDGLKADIIWAAIGGLATGPLALVLLPFFAIGGDTASNFRLNRYGNLNRPLIKELLSKAPGTYQHSMGVAYLAQRAGQAVGANTLLLKIGAYYHDIGKMMNPRFFAENQSGSENPHPDQEPRESARINFNHVRHGLRIGHESGLPKAVVDLIRQHHGTRLMEEYYNSASQTEPPGAVRKKDFRYPGPKPQSVEAAILMVTDSLEPACRSLTDPTRNKFEKLIRLNLIKRIADDQLAECDLSSRDLSKIVPALVEALEAWLLSPTAHPVQADTKAPPETGWRIGADSETEPGDRAFRP